MKFSPLKCGVCGQNIVVGQMANLATDSTGYNFVVHSANKREFVDLRLKKNFKTSCKDAVGKGWV
jgi:hypothetical protein